MEAQWQPSPPRCDPHKEDPVKISAALQKFPPYTSGFTMLIGVVFLLECYIMLLLSGFQCISIDDCVHKVEKISFVYCYC